MNNFKQSDEIILIDGSFDGLLSSIYVCYKNRTIPKDIVCEKDYIDNLFDDPIFIETDEVKANKVFGAIKTKVGNLAIETILTAFLSKDKSKYKIIYDFIYYGFIYGGKVNYLRTIPTVTTIQKIAKNVKHEAHKFKGFVRFSKTSNNIFYSKIKPDNDILEFVAYHFKFRLKNECWVIIDEGRCKGAFYDKNKVQIITDISLKDIDIKLSDEEKLYEDLWKHFYNSVNIKERRNRKCQLNFMPKKYWINLLEVQSYE